MTIDPAQLHHLEDRVRHADEFAGSGNGLVCVFTHELRPLVASARAAHRWLEARNRERPNCRDEVSWETDAADALVAALQAAAPEKTE